MDVQASARFAGEQVRQGAERFAGLCVQGHGAPGAQRGEIGKGERPRPPSLAEKVPEWSTAELYWILEHGIKMSGMPAFGPTHGEEELWNLVAFLERLPSLTPEAYQRLAGGGSGEETAGHGGTAPGQEEGTQATQ